MLAAVAFAAVALDGQEPSRRDQPAAIDAGANQSIARQWNELLLAAIRRDFARPTVHARNLFHVSVALWDAWAAYDWLATPYLSAAKAPLVIDVAAARREAMSYAAYRVLTARFANSPGAEQSQEAFDAKMSALGYDPRYAGTVGTSPAAIGNRIGTRVLAFGIEDGANEAGGYAYNNGYRPVNRPLPVAQPGPGRLVDPNRWQPLALEQERDQAGNLIPRSSQLFLGPHWGQVRGFATVLHDPGPPPQLGGAGHAEFQQMFADVVAFSSVLTPDDGAMLDISPAARGNNTLGANDGNGHRQNPITGLPYAPNPVRRGDWARVIAEFWADGPDSETPPGHWNTLANYVSDSAMLEHRIGGDGTEVDRLEWDVKLYLALNAALHDAAVAAWGIKGHYDYVRPISAIRHMCNLGQSADRALDSFHQHGIPLRPGVIEVVTQESSAPGARHQHLGDHRGEIAVFAWRGKPADSNNEHGGVGWIACSRWVPYQRDTFVTPPFAGYVSGHSTFSRAAAEVLASFTGSPFFPGGLGEWHAPQRTFLAFEAGPSRALTLQWATYFDASDEAAISRLYGGIHPRADDLPGRIIGSAIGKRCYTRALTYFDGTAQPIGG